MPDETHVMVNGRLITVPAGAMVIVALLLAESPSRISVDGQPRTALCGMGICFECRATVDGVQHTRTCQIVCRSGMVVETQR